MSEESRSPQGDTLPNSGHVARRIVKNVALNMIPGYPLIAAVRSFRAAASPGASVITDLSAKLPRRRAGRVRRSWNEALAARPADALPLRIIERRNKQAKWIFMAGCFFALCAGTGCVVNLNWRGTLNCTLFLLVCAMQTFKHELRLRQMETGPLLPDAPLISARQFLRSRGFLKQLFNPRLEWK